MTPDQEDALIASVYDKKYSELSLDESIRLAIRAAVAAERERCAKIVGTYQVPVGNSPAGELACDWTMDALREIAAAIRKGGQ